MAYEPKDGSGALFKNDKGDNPARPDYRGDIMLNGVLYELSAWIKPLASDTSKRFMSLSGKPKESRPVQRQETPRQAPARAAPAQRQSPAGGVGWDGLDMDDPIPF